MKRRILPVLGPALAAAIASFWVGHDVAAGAQPPEATQESPRPAGGKIALQSPNGRINVVFQLRKTSTAVGEASYRITYRGKTILRPSPLGIDLADQKPLNHGLAVRRVARESQDRTYRVFLGKSRWARDHYRQAAIDLEEQAAPYRRLTLVFRAYDDGVAFRYRIPKQKAISTLSISQEQSSFAFAGNPKVFALPLGGFRTSYENYYWSGSLDRIDSRSLIGLPLLLAYPEGILVAVTEAALTDYAGMYLAPSTQNPGTLVSRLAPLPTEPEICVKAPAPHSTPWRVLMIADGPAALIESSLILDLNEPCAIRDPSWITPGKTTFPWWNGYTVGDVGFKGAMNTKTIKHYIDFCAEQGVPFHTLDGFQGTAWYGGPITPYRGANITTSHPDIDLPAVRNYARERGVRLRLWMHWKAARKQMDRAFPLYQSWGIDGVMVDFMDRDDQEMVRFYHRLIQTAAHYHLTVTLHGAYKPTGIRRTYPNLLTREAVMNLEYDKWGSRPSTPEHELTVPFVRMLAGPLDYHLGSFRTVREKDFRARNRAPRAIGTRCRTLAMYVVYENPLQMVADYPEAYRNQLGWEFLKEVPTVWDTTKVLNAAIGDYLSIARQTGRQWYVGSITDSHARELRLPLGFLGAGRFMATIYSDVPLPNPVSSKLTRRQIPVTASTVLTARLAPAGGHAIRITPIDPRKTVETK